MAGKCFLDRAKTISQFKAIIYGRGEDVDETTGTATPVSNISRYSTNLLEFTSIPSKLWRHLCEEAREPSSNGAAYGFPASGGGRWSFAKCDSPRCTSDPIATEALLETREGRREFIGLVNLCLGAFLRERGLRVDVTRKRAYFPRTKEGSREVRYQATFRQATRTVTKPFVSKVSQRVLYWVHEAIWFGVERFGRQYVLRVLPGYVFTLDGLGTLLDHKRIGALATRKAARDFSLQVFNHLVFWSFALSNGESQFEIQTGGEPLVVKAAFAVCDLQMPSRADVEFVADEFQNRLDARLEDLETEIAEDREVE